MDDYFIGVEAFRQYRETVRTSAVIENATLKNLRPYLPFIEGNRHYEHFLRGTLENLRNPNQWKKISRRLEIPTVYLEMPPVLVEKGFRILELRHENGVVNGHYNHESGRCESGYQYPGVDRLFDSIRNEKSSNVLFTKQAADYALKNWWDLQQTTHPLRLDTWADFIGIQFRNKEGKTRHLDTGKLLGQPAVYFVTTRPLHEMMLSRRPGSDPLQARQLLSESLDDAIVPDLITMDIGAAFELRGQRKGHFFSSCIQCGSGLQRSNCHKCGTKFDELLATPWACAPPQKIIQYLESKGYEVPRDIKIAKMEERHATGTTGPIPVYRIKE